MAPYRTTAARNQVQQALSETGKAVGQPQDRQERISYGIISKVNADTSQVKVRMLKADKEPGEEISPQFLPLINSLSEIHHLYGALREGLLVRIYWRGKLGPKNDALIEVIGDEDSSFLKKSPENNEIDIGPFKIFSGGLG